MERMDIFKNYFFNIHVLFFSQSVSTPLFYHVFFIHAF